MKNKKPSRYKRIYIEYKNATNREIWEGVRDNFIFGFLGAILVVFVATKTDLAVLFNNMPNIQIILPNLFLLLQKQIWQYYLDIWHIILM